MSIWAMAWAFEQTIESAGMKFTYVALCNFADEKGECWPSQETLAKMTGQSVRSIRRHLEQLEEDGYISRQRYRDDEGQWERYRYRVQAPPDKLSPGPHTSTGQTKQPTGHLRPDPPDTVSDKPSLEPLVNSTRSNGSFDPPAKTNQQHLTEQLYAGVREKHNIRLTKEQFSYHVGKFRDILTGDDPSPDELDRVIAHMVNVVPKAPKIEARIALQDVRLGRDTGEAWEGPQPWEKNGEPVNPHSTEGQKLRDKKRQLRYYMSAYPDTKDEKVKGTWEACSTHTDILNILERRK